MNSLAFVQCHSSCVLGAPLDEVWDLVRSWVPCKWLAELDGRIVSTTVVVSGPRIGCT